jgi:inosine-uridine nucleoside N-ribohydrolase
MKSMTRRQVIGGAVASGLAAMAPKVAFAGEADAAIEQTAAATLETKLGRIHRVIVDTDPGNDDALALLMALDTDALQVEAVTVCPGNMGPEYEQQVKNALYIVDLAGRGGHVPVHAGMAHPILDRPYPVATFIHGKYGLGSVEAPEVRQKVADEHAVDAMRRIVHAAPGEITILALGGLTNIAMALLRDPAFARDLQGIQFVGGRYAMPGMPPSYNVLVDPEAAHVVFTSGVPIVLAGADVIGRNSVLEDADFDHIAGFNTGRSRFFMATQDLRRTFEKTHRGTTGSTNPDPMAVALAVNPALATKITPLFVHVELNGELTRGLLVYGEDIYRGNPTPAPNVEMVLEAKPELFRQMVFALLSKG